MDGSREADLYALKQRMDDESLTPMQRTRAWRNFEKIKLQVFDRKLIELRRRLVAATQANDHDTIEKLQGIIHEYSYRMGYK